MYIHILLEQQGYDTWGVPRGLAVRRLRLSSFHLHSISLYVHTEIYPR